MAYQVDQWGFVRWLGSPPRLVSEHVALFTKPGQPGVSAQLMGEYGEPFDAELHAAFATQALAAVAEQNYRFLVGSSPVVVVHNAKNYWTIHGHLYLILRAEVTDVRCHPRLMGPGYDYIGGWLVRSRWTMQPVA